MNSRMMNSRTGHGRSQVRNGRARHGIRRREWMKLAAVAACAPAAWGAEKIPAHPDQLKFSRLDYDAPKPANYRHELPGGAVAYVVEDHQLPLVGISMTIRTGGYLTEADRTGLASSTGSQMRAGGTKTISARDFDEEAAFLASKIGSNIGATSGSASVDCLKSNLEPTLKLFFDMLKNPGFDEERLKLAQARQLQGMERRNDRTAGVERREFARLMRGDNHFSSRQATKASVESVTRERMMEFHQRYYASGSMIFAVSGDVDTKEILARLGQEMTGGWPASEHDVPKVPAPEHQPAPGVYMVNKPEVNQSRIAIGHLGIQRDNPDRFAVSMMNQILGGGGFTSRIMSRVRSDEGLAYSAGTSFQPGTYYPGTFRAGFQSMNPRCAQATAIVLEELDRIRQEKVSEEELAIAKNYSIEIFPRFFATASAVAGTFAADEYTGREKGYWDKYRDRIAAVTQDDVLRVAQKYIHPDRLVILGVGKVDEMLAGNPDKPEFQFKTMAKGGDIGRIPLPDPLTMVYPEA
jgi:zinc protease